MRADSDPRRAGPLPLRAGLALITALLTLPFVLLASAPAPAADLQSRLDAKQAQLEDVQAKKGVLTTTISTYGDRIDSLEGQVAGLRRREAAVQARLAAKQAELDRAEAELGRAKKRLDVLRGRLKRALIVLRGRLVAIYEAGSPDTLTVILSANGFDDLVNRTEYLNRIQDLDQTIVSRVRSLRDQTRSTVKRLRVVKQQIEAARDAIAAEERRVASARAAVEGRQAELIAARAQRESALATIRDTEQELEGDVSDIQSQIQAQLQAVPSAPLPAGPLPAPSSSGLIWPVNGPVVSGFGWRFGGGEFHEGVDIGVGTGTPIQAAASGTVVLLQSEASSGGYGNFTCVDHGGGLSTCYAHQESFAVSAGQQVSQGQVIGYTDCTGYCFGPHLHFEVRVNGVPQDPLGYL